MHAIGDAVLYSFVQTVMVLLRESDLIGHLGAQMSRDRVAVDWRTWDESARHKKSPPRRAFFE